MLFGPQCAWMGVPTPQKMKITSPPPISNRETASGILCAKQDVLCPAPSRDEVMVIMAGPALHHGSHVN
jgi:hypothetical protein